jgi:acyl carrier protein
MHGRESVGARVAAILADRLNIDAVPVEADLFAAAALDSLGLVELLLGLEDEFGINISADDLELDRFRSISSITTFVASKLEPRNGHDVALAVRRIAG